MFPQSSGRPDPALSWVRQRRCYQWQLWGHSREEFVLCYFFQHLVRLEWLVSQHLWLCRKAPRQWRPSKSVSLPARPSPPFPLKSFGLLCPWPDFERTNHQYWMRADISEEEYQQMCWDRSADWIRAACEVWHQSPLQRAARQSTPAGPGQSRPVASRQRPQLASLDSWLQRHSLPPHRYIFAAPSCFQRGTDFGFLSAEVSRSQLHPHQRLSCSRSTGKLVWKDPRLCSCFQGLTIAFKPSLFPYLLSLYYVPGVVLNVRDQGVNKANMTPAFKELTVQWGYCNHKD